MGYRYKKAFEVLIAASMAVVIFVTNQPLIADEIPDGPMATGNAWKFRVFLDDKEIGYHHFYVAGSGETRQLKSVASFQYKLLFVRLFHYEHENTETWAGDCLQSINSRTDENGKMFQVDGRREAGEFLVAGSTGEASLPECVMSFAYWNPSFLDQSTLLNTQNGEFQEVEISPPVFEELEVLGELRPSWRYRLATGALNLDLWYSTDREWLALEGKVQGGRKLRYELSES
jgi:hypothetical protein